MSTLVDILGGGLVQSVGNIVDDLHTSEAEKREADLKELQEVNKLLTGQLEVNKVEASHASIFVAGWRPFIGWICGASLGLYYIPKAIMMTGMWAYAAWKLVMAWNGQGGMPALPEYPDFGVWDLIGLVGTMLGMATIRHREVVSGKARGAIAPSGAAAGTPPNPFAQEAP